MQQVNCSTIEGWNESGPLNPFLKSYQRISKVQSDGIYWRAEFFGLDQVSHFVNGSQEKQQEVLRLCSQQLLSEALLIEHFGMTYAAKMNLLSETIDEKTLYACIAADEAKHFMLVSQYIQIDPVSREHEPFFQLLRAAISGGHRMPLIYIIQVVLEGWGLSHYLNLSNGCIDSSLAEILAQIVKDEGRHHGSGLVLFQEDELTSEEFEFAFETVRALLEMVRIGPVGVVSALEQVFGPFQRNERISIMDQLRGPETSDLKLQQLNRLMRKPKSSERSILTNLENCGFFSPYSTTDAADIVFATADRI